MKIKETKFTKQTHFILEGGTIWDPHQIMETFLAQRLELLVCKAENGAGEMAQSVKLLATQA